MGAMTPSIEFFFDFISPYGWFAAERIGGLAHRPGRVGVWQPLLLKATGVETMGLPALLETPLKGEYLLPDATRSERFYGLPWHPPASMSFSSVAAERAVVWAADYARLDPEPLVVALYRRAWADGGDISTVSAVADLAASIGIECDRVRDGIESAETKANLSDRIVQAVRRGIFGSPFIVVDGEAFWGADRLCMVERWLDGGW